MNPTRYADRLPGIDGPPEELPLFTVQDDEEPAESETTSSRPAIDLEYGTETTLDDIGDVIGGQPMKDARRYIRTGERPRDWWDATEHLVADAPSHSAADYGGGRRTAALHPDDDRSPPRFPVKQYGPKPARTNRYAAKCADCAGWVEAEAGTLTKGERWETRHTGGCPEVAELQDEEEAPDIEAGRFYTDNNDEMYIGRISRTGNPYAVTRSKQYVGQVWKNVEGWRPLTLDEAKIHGRNSGRCLICSRELTNPDSIAAGIGPICAERF